MHNVWFKVWSSANGARSGPGHELEQALCAGGRGWEWEWNGPRSGCDTAILPLRGQRAQRQAGVLATQFDGTNVWGGRKNGG